MLWYNDASALKRGRFIWAFSSREHSIRYCRKSARCVLLQKHGLQGFPVGKQPGGHRHHHGDSAAPRILCCEMTAATWWLSIRYGAHRYFVSTARSAFSLVNPGNPILRSCELIEALDSSGQFGKAIMRSTVPHHAG